SVVRRWPLGDAGTPLQHSGDASHAGAECAGPAADPRLGDSAVAHGAYSRPPESSGARLPAAGERRGPAGDADRDPAEFPRRAELHLLGSRAQFPLRIDAHQHFTREYSPDLLAPILKRNRFDATVLIGGADWEAYAGAEIVRAVVVALDLADPCLPHVLDRLQRHPKFRGAMYGFEDGSLPSGLEELARRKLTLDLPPRPELAAAIAERFPE